VYSVNQVKKSFDKQHIWIKQQQWKKLHEKEISQPSSAGDSRNPAVSRTPEK